MIFLQLVTRSSWKFGIIHTPQLHYVPILTSNQIRRVTVKQSAKNSNQRYFLGLDVASKTTGYTVLDSEGNFIRSQHSHRCSGMPIESGLIDTSHTQNVYEYGMKMKEAFQNLSSKYQNVVWTVGVEEFMKRYNKTSTTTLYKLCTCNTLASYEAVNVFQTLPIKISVLQARSFFKLNKKSSEVSTKEMVYHKLKHLLPKTYMPVFGKRNKEKLMPCNYDVTDSLLIAIYTSVLFRIDERLGDKKEVSSFFAEEKKRKLLKDTRHPDAAELEFEKKLTQSFEKHIRKEEYEKVIKKLQLSLFE